MACVGPTLHSMDGPMQSPYCFNSRVWACLRRRAFRWARAGFGTAVLMVELHGLDSVAAHDALPGTGPEMHGMAAPPLDQNEVSRTELLVYSAVLNDYLVPDLGVFAYEGWVLQTGATVRFPSGIWIDLWNSTPLPRKSGWNINNYGEEIDLTLGYATDVGRAEISGNIAYYANQPFGRFRDDIVQIALRARVPLTQNQFTVTPYVQPQVWIGTPEFPDHVFLRYGVAVTGPLSGRWSADIDVSAVTIFNLDRTVVRSDLTLNYAITSGTSLSALARLSSEVRPVFGIGLSRKF